MKKLIMMLAVGSIMTLAAFANEKPATADQPQSVKPTANKMIGDTVLTPSGLKYIEIKKGTGAMPKAGQTISAHYTGWLTDGKKFDSSRDRRKPYFFPLGRGTVIKGWEEAFATMNVGGVRKLIIPPDLAYGDRGFPGAIPPKATLIYEIELVDVK